MAGNAAVAAGALGRERGAATAGTGPAGTGPAGTALAGTALPGPAAAGPVTVPVRAAAVTGMR